MNALDELTPLILTYNEAPNIGRTLDALSWAKQIVVIDSFSEDETLEIIARYPHARVVQREWDSMADQWNFGLDQVQTEWVLSLDADYLVTDELQGELGRMLKSANCAGYMIPFRYCVFGKPLRASLLPPRCALFRRACSTYYNDGHTQRLKVDGAVGQLNHPLHHDDRKNLTRWLENQIIYMDLEADKLLSREPASLGLVDRLRRWVVPAPLLVFAYCLLFKGMILQGHRGIYYTFQRTLAELLLSLEILERRFRQ